jgi:hypothetical protein
MRLVVLSSFQIIGAILSAFGGALLKAEPPNTGNTNATTYIAAFSAAILLLVITSVAKYFGARIKPLYWGILSLLFLGAFVVTAIVYERDKRKLTIGLPPNAQTDWYIIGTQKTPYGEDVFQNAKRLTPTVTAPADVVWGVSGSIPERIRRIWTLNSIEQSIQLLTREYMMVIVFLSVSIFFGAEGAKRSDYEQEQAPPLKDRQGAPAHDNTQSAPTADSGGEPKEEVRLLMQPRSTNPVEVFFSYAHEDEQLKDKLADQLAILQRLGVITKWHDRLIGAGADWRVEIERRLNSAHIILLLVSADFLASDFCYGAEMARAIERHDRGEALVIPVILRACRWTKAPFGRLQALPKDGKPVTSWSNLDEAFENVAEGIETAVEAQRTKERL